MHTVARSRTGRSDMRLLPLHALAIVALLGTGNALGAEDIAAAVNACRAEADDARRLACYDRAVGRANGNAPAAAPAAAATAATAPAPAPAPAQTEDSFGRERQLAHEEDQKRAEATRAV